MLCIYLCGDLSTPSICLFQAPVCFTYLLFSQYLSTPNTCLFHVSVPSTCPLHVLVCSVYLLFQYLSPNTCLLHLRPEYLSFPLQVCVCFKVVCANCLFKFLCSSSIEPKWRRMGRRKLFPHSPLLGNFHAHFRANVGGIRRPMTSLSPGAPPVSTHKRNSLLSAFPSNSYTCAVSTCLFKLVSTCGPPICSVVKPFHAWPSSVVCVCVC